MTRRERKQLLRTASDIFRMVPLAVSFVVATVTVRLIGSQTSSAFAAVSVVEIDLYRSKPDVFQACYAE